MGYKEPPFSVSQLTERLFPEIEVVGRPMEQHAAIEVYRKPLPNGKRAVIAYNERGHHSTQRFSIAHEIGHWVIDFDKGNAAPKIRTCGQISDGTRPLPERRADYFAAELLCPLWKLDGFVDFEIYADRDDEDAIAGRDQKVQRLASRFNLSLACLKRRVFDLHAWRKITR